MIDFTGKNSRVLLNILSDETCGAILLTRNHDHLPTLLEMTENSLFRYGAGRAGFI